MIRDFFVAKKLRELPGYMWIPLGLALAINLLTYFGTRPLTDGLTHYDFSMGIDSLIPFVPAFIVFYVLAYVQWAVGYVGISLESRDYCYRILTGEILAKLMCLLCFFLIPTEMVRPEITGTSIWDSLTGMIYMADEPNNLFPSIHCLESWFCMRGTLGMKKAPAWYKWAMVAVSLGVFASTVLIKQHVFLDFIGAVAVAELALYISNKFRLYKLFYGRGK